MRHILLPRPMATGTERMGNATAVARLVALSGRTLPLAPGDLGTAVGTIDLAAIAAATDQHLNAATDTQKETGWRSVRAVGLRTWTKSATSEIMPPHSGYTPTHRRPGRNSLCFSDWQILLGA